MVHHVIRAAPSVVQAGGSSVPALFAGDVQTAKRFVDFFTANIRNLNTRRAYARAVQAFAAWWKERRLGGLQDIEPVHIATYVEALCARMAAPSVKIHLAALRMLFDWLVLGRVLKATTLG